MAASASPKTSFYRLGLRPHGHVSANRIGNAHDERGSWEFFVGSLEDDFQQNYLAGVEAEMARRGAVKSAGNPYCF